MQMYVCNNFNCLLHTDPLCTISKVDLYLKDFNVLKDGNWLNCRVMCYIAIASMITMCYLVDGSIHGIINRTMQAGTTEIANDLRVCITSYRKESV